MESMFSLAGRRAIVTGASRGIGQAIAVGLARQGADVLAVARSADALEETAALACDASGSVVSHVADLRSTEEIDATVDRAVAELGGLDILVNNAASGHYSRLEQTDLATFQQVIDLNLRSCWLLCQKASAALQAGDGGSVVNVASMLGLVSNTHESAYVAAKHGLVGVTRALALEWARRGVRVNALAPGYVETAMTTPGLVLDDYAAMVLRKTPMGR